MDSLIPFTTSGSLVDCVDSTSAPKSSADPVLRQVASICTLLPLFDSLGKMLVILRDGRKLHGVLRSYDQFGTHYSLAKHAR